MDIPKSQQKAIIDFFKARPEIFERIIKSVDVSKNKNRQEIINLLEKHGPMNMTQIQQKVGIAYKNVLNHIKKLEEAKLVKTEKQEKEMGRQVIVSLTSKNVEIYEETMKDFSRIAKSLKERK